MVPKIGKDRDIRFSNDDATAAVVDSILAIVVVRFNHEQLSIRVPMAKTKEMCVVMGLNYSNHRVLIDILDRRLN